MLNPENVIIWCLLSKSKKEGAITNYILTFPMAGVKSVQKSPKVTIELIKCNQNTTCIANGALCVCTVFTAVFLLSNGLLEVALLELPFETSRETVDRSEEVIPKFVADS